jgi:hypothetical protein
MERECQARDDEGQKKDRQDALSAASEGDDLILGGVEGLGSAGVSAVADLKGVTAKSLKHPVRTRSACMRVLVKSLRGPVHVNLDPLPVLLHNLSAPLHDPRPKLPTPLSDWRPEGLAWFLHDSHLLS